MEEQVHPRLRSEEGSEMLVLSRKLGEKIYIGENICITVVDIDRGKIRLGIEAPRDVPIYRQELLPLNKAPQPAAPTTQPAALPRPCGAPPDGTPARPSPGCTPPRTPRPPDSPPRPRRFGRAGGQLRQVHVFQQRLGSLRPAEPVHEVLGTGHPVQRRP